MTRYHNILLILASFGLFFGLGAAVAQPDERLCEVEGEFSERIQRELTETVVQVSTELEVPGVLAGLWVPGVGSWTAAFGVADLETGEPVTFDQHFRVGSLTKTFTGTLVLQLADEGLLSLDDPVARYFGTHLSSDKIMLRNEIPNADEITVRNLLNMTSGIASYTFDPDFQKTLFSQPERGWKPVELADVGVYNTVVGCPYTQEQGGSACFEPGTDFFYSNTNTVLLGLIIEHITGQAYPEVLQEKILEPLGLEKTSYPRDADLAAPYAHGYTAQGLDSGRQDATHWNPTWGDAAGSMVSTFGDLRRWGCALGRGELLSDEMQAERLTEVTVGPNVPGERAYALGIGNNHGWWGHGGALPGYNAAAYYRPDLGAVLVVMTTTDTGNPAFVLADAIIDVAARESPQVGDFEETVPYSDPSLRDEND